MVIEWFDSLRRPPVSFGIMDEQGGMFFVIAHSFRVDRRGRLVFWERRGLFRRLKSVVEAGKWERVLEGISMDDFKGDEHGNHS